MPEADMTDEEALTDQIQRAYEAGYDDGWVDHEASARCITCGHTSPHDVPPIQVCRDPGCGCDGPSLSLGPSLPGVPQLDLLETCQGPGGPPWRTRPKFAHNAIAHPLLWLWPRVGWWLHDRTEPD